MRNGVTTAYYWLALLIAVCIVVQVFLAGLGVFGAESFDAHESFGWIIHTAAILLFILALIGPRTRRAIGMSFGLLALMTVQIMLVGARDDTPWVAAFHPTLALFVLGLAIHIGMPAISRRRAASAPRPAR
jgi:mercuric ion transport protein